MKIGITLSNQLSPSADPAEALRGLIEQATLAQEVGLDSVWVLHHVLAPLPVIQPLELLCHLAHLTGRMTLGTNILIAPLFHPLQLAESVATVDALTGGRLVLGLGLGYREDEFRSYGIPLADRARRLEETVEVMRAYWAGDEIVHCGEIWQFSARGGFRGIRPGGPPIWLGGGTRPAIRRAARIADAHLIVPTRRIERLPESVEMTKSFLAAAGKPVDREYPVVREVCLAENARDAHAAARPAMLREGRAYAEEGAAVYEERFDDIYENASIIGAPEDARSAIERIRDSGCTQVLARCQWLGLRQDVVLRTIRLLGELARQSLDSTEVSRKESVA